MDHAGPETGGGYPEIFPGSQATGGPGGGLCGSSSGSYLWFSGALLDSWVPLCDTESTLEPFSNLQWSLGPQNVCHVGP